ncbi:hypothetical protein [Caballeronia sp. ATUFL_F1_KS4A]|uniref:hypothetical protein n=1 Tax=Caballeronia sp. ATUFL_F1_KS4A TaxID=2921768 RepID=UPI0020291A90|nr:hypothetical protein [Caballeronia sp. ATUFL_F1_KS4A]
MMLMISGRCGGAIEQNTLFERESQAAGAQVIREVPRTRNVIHFSVRLPNLMVGPNWQSRRLRHQALREPQ